MENEKAQKAIEDARLSIPRSGGLAIKAKYGNDYFSQLRKKGIEKQRKEKGANNTPVDNP